MDRPFSALIRGEILTKLRGKASMSLISAESVFRAYSAIGGGSSGWTTKAGSSLHNALGKDKTASG